jgi:hypothetical protein
MQNFLAKRGKKLNAASAMTNINFSAAKAASRQNLVKR